MRALSAIGIAAAFLCLLTGDVGASSFPVHFAKPLFWQQPDAAGHFGYYAELHSFGSGTDGYKPANGLIYEDGKFYGTTEDGGGNNSRGTFFDMTSSGTVHVIHRFGLTPGDGFEPQGNLVYLNGAFYGTTQAGGKNNLGMIFSLTAGNKEKVIYSFGGGADGANPVAGLVYANGVFYGTTDEGGTYNYGMVFEVTADGTEHVLHSFGNGTDGRYPLANLIYESGALFGTTCDGGTYQFGNRQGGGTVFDVTADGTEHVLYNFGGYRGDGNTPQAGLVYANGAFYGTTSEGGVYNYGTVFEMTPRGSETVLHSFGYGTDGTHPEAGLLYSNLVFYGTTLQGGAYNDMGTVFQITSAGTERVLHNFGLGTDGAEPIAPLMYANGFFFGTTNTGGADNRGTIFELLPASSR